MLRSEIKLGLIGAGPWGKNYIHTIDQIHGIKLVRVASRNPKTRKLLGPDCTIEADWHRVSEATEISGVIIATPPHCHAEMVESALNNGLAILVEKPITSTKKDAENLLNSAKKVGGLVMVDHIHLFHPGFRSLKQFAKELGSINSISSYGGGSGPFRKDIRALWDWGTHDIAMCIDLIGASPKVIRARYLEQSQKNGEEGELIEAELSFPNGTEATLTVGNLMKEKTRVFQAKFDVCSLIYEPNKPNPLIKLNRPIGGKSDSASTEVIRVNKELPLNCIVREFAESISSNKKDISSLALSLEVITVLDDIAKVLDKK